MPMRPIKTGDRTLCCLHWRTWPPLEAFEGLSPADLRGALSAPDFQRYQIWERECGLLGMAVALCQECKFVRLLEIKPPQVPMMVSMDGRHRIPIVDRSFVEALPGYRRAKPPSREKEIVNLQHQVAIREGRKVRRDG